MRVIAIRNQKMVIDGELGTVTVWFCIQFANNGMPVEFLAHIPVTVLFDPLISDVQLIDRALRALEKKPPLMGRTNGTDVTHLFTYEPHKETGRA